MKRLLSYMCAYKKESILGPLFKMLEASFELFVPLVVANMVDVGIANGSVSYVVRMGGLLLLLAIIGLTCSLTAQYFAAKAATGTATALRNNLFSHIGTLSYTEIDTIGTSTLITRMTSDINQVQNGINMTLRLLLRSPFVVFGAMVMAFTVDAHTAMVFAVTIPVLCVVIFGIMLISMPLYQSVQRQLDKVLLTTRENLMGVRVIRAFNRQENEREKFEEENGSLVKMQVFVGKISALLNPVTYVIINIATVAVIWVGAGRVDAGIIILISKAVACMKRVDSVFEIKSSIEEKPHEIKTQNTENEMETTQKISPETAKMEFDHVDFAYAGAKSDSLTDISFKAMKGQTIGVIGGTGSGKSTLVNLIPRFYDVREGKVLIDGADVRDLPLTELRHAIGVVPQRAVLFKGTLRDNMRWGKEDATDEEIWHALDVAQARDFIEAKGEGLDLMIDQGGHNLSGGQRQRLTIARALVRDPQILIMDDSASALDFATDARLRKAIRENTKDMTVFIVSQRATTIRNADTILVLDDGKLAGIGNHKQLLKECDVYREICLSQLSKEEVERDEQ